MAACPCRLRAGNRRPTQTPAASHRTGAGGRRVGSRLPEAGSRCWWQGVTGPLPSTARHCGWLNKQAGQLRQGGDTQPSGPPRAGDQMCRGHTHSPGLLCAWSEDGLVDVTPAFAGVSLPSRTLILRGTLLTSGGNLRKLTLWKNGARISSAPITGHDCKGKEGVRRCKAGP